jgi:peptidoglycan/xylan/chitin deacetylase (PgdA/CDA1 family)
MSMREPGAFVVSLDFELYWGMRDVVTLEDYRANLEGSPMAIRRMLDVFEQREIHATWACVGLLFAKNAQEARRFTPRVQPSYRARELSPFPALELELVDEQPHCYFAPELIAAIGARPHQEIGTHTFSHYYCNEVGQTPEQFDADLAAAVAIAEQSGVRLRSLVFPRNQTNLDYLPILARHGITSYRGLTANWAFEHSDSQLGTIVRRGARLADNYAPLCPGSPTVPFGRAERLRGTPVNIPGSRFLRPYNPRLRHLDPLRLHRMQTEMTHAAEAGHIYHLWWHPHNFGVHTSENLRILDRLLEHADVLRRRFGLRSMNMGELAAAQ